MFYVNTTQFTNEYYEISGRVAAALSRHEISFDILNDQAALSRLNVGVGVDLQPKKVMFYTDRFVEYLDGYDKGWYKRIYFAL